MIAAPISESQRMLDGARQVAQSGAEALEQRRPDMAALTSVFRLIRDWTSHGWYGMPEAERLRDAMASIFPENWDASPFERLLRWAANGRYDRLEASALADAVERLRLLEKATA